MGLGGGVIDRAVGDVGAAARDKALVQRVQQVERVGVAVIVRPRGADHRRADPRQHVAQFGRAEHAVVEAEIAGLGAHLLHPSAAFFELRIAEAEMHPARPLVADGDAGAVEQLGGERRPFVGGKPGPALVMRRAEALRLHPDQPEIAARGAEGDITLVDQRGVEAGARQSIGDRRADQPAADHDRVKPLHSRIIAP